MKIGRNEPCPCGSGLKYKRCCQHREESSAAARAREAPDGRGLRLRMGDRVATMTTEALEGRLEGLGIPYSRERFLELARTRSAAFAIAEPWLRGARIRPGDDEDFVILAVKELWERLLPGHPPDETLDDCMQDGYDHDAAGRSAEASRLWWKVWEEVRPRLTPEMRTLDAAEDVFSGTQFFSNWCCDFELCLGNAALEDPELAAVGQQYCSEWLEQFTEEEGNTQVNFLRALAWFQFEQGETSAGEATLQAMVERWPEEVWAWIAVADAYGGLLSREKGPAEDVPRALAALDRALAVADDDDDFSREAVLERRNDILGASAPG